MVPPGVSEPGLERRRPNDADRARLRNDMLRNVTHDQSHTAAPPAAKTASAAFLAARPMYATSGQRVYLRPLEPRGRAYAEYPQKTAAVSGFRAPRAVVVRLMCGVVGPNPQDAD